jgi:Spy/CpxP family protein refolding chaperone
MLSRVLSGVVISATVGATMVAMMAAPASAFTLSAPSLEPQLAASHIDPVYWHRGWGWRGGWGYRPWG